MLDYSGPDFYNETIGVVLCAFIRESLKFTTVEALKLEISTDCEFAREILKSNQDFLASRALFMDNSREVSFK